MSNIPVLSVKGESIPEAWENSVVELYNKGLWYKREGPKDKGQLQVDSTMTIEITNPDSGLFVHKYVTCGFEDLLEYEMEILGAKDSWVVHDAKDTRWPYHYHERFASYPCSNGKIIDQLESIIDNLSREYWMRRANVVTWVPERDLFSDNPPCLQRVWFSIIPDSEKKDSFSLNFNYNFRSRNVMIASPMNMDGMYTLQCYIRDRIIERTDMNLKNGRIVDFTDSYHVSAQDQHILKDFIDRIEKSKKKGEKTGDRSWGRDFVYKQMVDMIEGVGDKIIEYTKRRFGEKGQLEKLPAEIEKIKKISDIRRKYYGS